VTFVPLAQATSHGMHVQVAYEQSQIHEAPNVDPGGHLSAEEEARLYEYYGLDYTAAASGSDSEFIAPATDRVEETSSPRLRRHEGDSDPGA
jgi:hypothetical protein